MAFCLPPDPKSGMSTNSITPVYIRCVPGEAQTHDSYIKSVVLYLLSYKHIIFVQEIGFEPIWS